tara:strand:+ start:48603 stop:48719 length:117 start_codon:yes stop_codon:yes gene_type:complete
MTAASIKNMFADKENFKASVPQEKGPNKGIDLAGLLGG